MNKLVLIPQFLTTCSNLQCITTPQMYLIHVSFITLSIDPTSFDINYIGN